MKRMMIFGCNVELSPCRNEPCSKLNTAEQNSINESLPTELLLKERFAMIEETVHHDSSPVVASL